MKHSLTSICGAVVAAAVVLFSCSQPASDASAKFEANSATIAQVFADFEAESDDFFTHFNAEAVWRGTGLNAPGHRHLGASHGQVQGGVGQVRLRIFLVSPTKAVDGSVRGYFEWVINPSTEAKAVDESFDFNPDGGARIL